MKKTYKTGLVFFLCIAASFAAVNNWSPGKLLYKASSLKKLVETAASHNWSILFKKPNTADTLMIIVLRVEFNNGVRDSTDLTTGNGLFGIFDYGGGELREIKYYRDTSVYKYDRLPHDSAYCAHQLEYAADYFKSVSHDRLAILGRVLPAGAEAAYTVPHPMLYYSPGGKKREETYDDYSYRKTIGLMHFVKDALESANNDQARGSPFASIVKD
jgi:hypothetical protein